MTDANSSPNALNCPSRRLAMHVETEGEPARFDGSNAVATLEATWRAIAAHHPDLPRAVIVVASGTEATTVRRWGHWAAGRWAVEDGDRVGEVLIAGERMAQGADQVLSTLLHEAAHALAFARDIKDTSRQGRYHNTRYKLLAEQMGLSCSQGQHGWHVTELTDAARERYSEQLVTLTTLCERGWRHDAGAAGVQGKGTAGGEQDGGSDAQAAPKKAGRLTLSCGCETPRKIRIVPSIAELGDITCSVCGEAFTE